MNTQQKYQNILYTVKICFMYNKQVDFEFEFEAREHFCAFMAWKPFKCFSTISFLNSNKILFSV